ncbi:hypothetical protein CTRI78_v008793 [Colletotrichum trifolii]|uniref:Uncharacterized protein n=1 Tax=Colletotrichum trifolii TaxID=5466 RepID=A0A4R8QTX6_COLTR|nr:hypothetical protein CTRI78_v008793 [Colletotrichum trifolii]
MSASARFINMAVVHSPTARVSNTVWSTPRFIKTAPTSTAPSPIVLMSITGILTNPKDVPRPVERSTEKDGREVTKGVDSRGGGKDGKSTITGITRKQAAAFGRLAHQRELED